MVFEWTQDLWIASSAGGEAKRIVRDPARDAYPRFSPDGKRLVFSSDRSGSLQVFSMPLSGGETIQHTHHTEGNELECLSPDGRRALIRGLRERSGFLATRLMEIDLTTERAERRLFDATAHSAAWSPDGARVLFCRGGEQLYRQGYRGSRASQIWLYRTKKRTFERMITGDAEARSPLWLADGRGFYFVDHRTGIANLWLKKDGEEARPVTAFRHDGVITPDLSADGSTLVFRLGLDVFRLRPGIDREPVRLDLWTREDLPDVSTDTRKVTGTADADFTKDLNQCVFAAAGDLWKIERAGTAPSRLTETAASEDEPRFSADGNWLYFRRDDGLEANYFRARREHGNMRDEAQITRGERSKCRLKLSPDGSKIAWIEGTGDVFTAGTDGADPRRVFKCWDKPTFDWSPDGKWLALAAEDADANRDLWLVAADGGHEASNLTRHPGLESSPKWSADGKWLAFTAKRDETGESQLWRIHFGTNGPKPGQTDLKQERIQTKGIEPMRVLWAADSKSLCFQSKNATSKKLYSIGVDGKNMQVLAAQRGIPIRMTPQGDLLWLVGRTPEILTGKKSIEFPIFLEVQRPREEVLTLGFRRVWRTLGECFYDPDMNGRDWNAMRLKYEPAARLARDSWQFDRVISFLRGELNASHLVFQQSMWPGELRKASKEAKTAHPGLIFRDDEELGAPLRIARVLQGSPIAMSPEPPKPGDRVVRIAGEPVFNGTPLHRFLNGAEHNPLPIVLRGEDGRERVIELRCISYQTARALDLKERQAITLARVAASSPKIAYQAVPNMTRDALDELRIQIHRASRESELLILDLRDNGGGREADRMLNLFCQPVHSITVPRDGPAGYPIDRRPGPAWNKPMVVLCNQDTFSNAEIFCHAMKHIKRAPLVGIATAGGVISAIKTTIPDVGELQVPFRGWHHAETGGNYDKMGAQPDFMMDLTPVDESGGCDPQLEKALEVLAGKK